MASTTNFVSFDGGLAPVEDHFSEPVNQDVFTVISSEGSMINNEPKQTKKGFSRFFGRKKKEEDSLSDWLGVDDDFNAKESGREIGSWDNFSNNNWQGGATSSEDINPEELVDAITSLGDDELLAHDIWFVATGASSCNHAGMRAFFEEYRNNLRGAFLINLESVGAGDLRIIAREGKGTKFVADKRISNLVQQVSTDFHRPIEPAELSFRTTDASAAMDRSVRSLTIAGVLGDQLACSHCEDDMAQLVDYENINHTANVVTELIRRS